MPPPALSITLNWPGPVRDTRSSPGNSIAIERHGLSVGIDCSDVAGGSADRDGRGNYSTPAAGLERPAGEVEDGGARLGVDGCRLDLLVCSNPPLRLYVPGVVTVTCLLAVVEPTPKGNCRALCWFRPSA